MDLGKKAKTFVRLIAKELVEKHPDGAVLEGNIRKLFNAAGSSIQDKELLQHLNNYADSYVVMLGRRINALRKVEADRENQEALPSQLPFNCYQPGQSQVRKAAVRVLPVEEQLKVYIQDLVNKLHEDDSQEKLDKSLRNFKKYMKKEVKESMETVCGILASTNSTIAVAPEIKPKMMKLYLRGMEPVVKKCLAEQGVTRAASVQRKVKAFLMWSQVMKSQNETMECQQAVMEVKADIMRNYLELVLLSYRPTSPEELRYLDTTLYSFVTYVLDLSEPCILDILMRLKSINSTNRPVLESLVRFCLLPLPMLSDKEQAQQYDEYLRYMVAVAQLAAPLPSLRSIVENALSVPAPKEIVNYLSGRVDMSEWPTHKKFKGLMVTQFLLKEASESIISDVAKMLLEMDRGGVQMEEGSTETASQPLFFIDSGPGPSSQHVSMEVVEDEAIEDVEEAPSEGEEEAKSAASRQKKKRRPKPQESEGMDNNGEGQEDTGQGTSSQQNIIEDSAPQVFDLSSIDFSNFSKQSFPGILCSEKLEILKTSGIGIFSPSKSSASPEKPNGINLRNGGGLPKFDNKEEEEEDDIDSGAEFSEKMVILGLADNSDQEEGSPSEKRMAKSSKRKVPENQKLVIGKEDAQEEEIEKQEDKDGETGKEELESKLHQKPTRRKGRQSSVGSLPSSDLESGLESMKLASPRKSRRQRKSSGLSSTSHQLDAQDNLPEESVPHDKPSSPVIPSQLPKLSGLSAGRASPRKSPSVKNGSGQEVEPDTAKSPLRIRHRNVSGTSTTSNISVREEGSSTVIRRSLRKRTFSSSSLGSNLSDVDPKTKKSEAKVKARPRSRKTEVPVEETLVEEAEEVEEVNENDADSLASGPHKPARRERKSGKQGTRDVSETKEVKTAVSAKKASQRSAVTPGLKRYSLRSGQH